ncbi:hypothetical protein D3C84_1155970 [compost metagenome]
MILGNLFLHPPELLHEQPVARLCGEQQQFPFALFFVNEHPFRNDPAKPLPTRMAIVQRLKIPVP